MSRLLEKKVNGKFPFQYRNSAETNLAETFRRVKARQKKPAQPVEPELNVRRLAVKR